MPPAPLKFPKNAIMMWNGNKITDHNRSELSVDVNRIESTKRMANGRMRKYVVADKHSFSVSWNDLPDARSWTVDGFWGGKDIETFYKANAGEFELKVTNGDGIVNTFTVVFSDFSKKINRRGDYDLWDVSIQMEEV